MFGLSTASNAVILLATEIGQPIDRKACWSPIANGGVRITDRAGRVYKFSRGDIEEASRIAAEVVAEHSRPAFRRSRILSAR